MFRLLIPSAFYSIPHDREAPLSAWRQLPLLLPCRGSSASLTLRDMQFLCIWKGLVLFKRCLLLSQAIKWISNKSDWVEVQIAKIDNSCKLNVWNSYFVFFLTFFFSSGYFVLIEIKYMKGRCYSLQKLSLALPFYATFHQVLQRHWRALFRSLSQVCRTLITRALGLLTTPGSAGELCYKLMYCICLRQGMNFS